MYPAGNYMFKVNNRNTRKRCEICSKLTIKIPERRSFWKIIHFSVNLLNVTLKSRITKFACFNYGTTFLIFFLSLSLVRQNSESEFLPEESSDMHIGVFTLNFQNEKSVNFHDYFWYSSFAFCKGQLQPESLSLLT